MSIKKINVGVVGATGLVGETFLEWLDKSRLQIGALRLFASEKSEGQSRQALGKTWPVESLKLGCFDGLDLVFFSSGDEISREWAPLAVKSGAYAIDNSAAFRMDPNVALVVPEVNADAIGGRPSIIANPNCSTIQLVVALNALKKFGLKSVRVATYQAASGAGKLAQQELLDQILEGPNGSPVASQFPKPLAFNVIPQIGSFDESGFCSEELKIKRETKKILSMPELKVSAFTVRVPVYNSHSEAVWVELGEDVSRSEVVSALHSQVGLVVTDSIRDYPDPKMANGKPPVYVGRIHKDNEDPKTWLMWIVADNLLKGAAYNGIQIAERIFAS